MTKNQIEYQKLLETKRSNRANEIELQRSNRAQEYLTNRRDTISLDLRARELAETGRSNVAREYETHRSNLAKESENYRSNLAREQEIARSNMAQEQEMRRHNLRSEGLEGARISLGYSQLAETRRSNVMQEQLQQLREQETRRANLVNERLTGERQREQARHNAAQEWETKRSNKAMEANKSRELDIREEKSDRDFGLGVASTVISGIGTVSGVLNNRAKRTNDTLNTINNFLKTGIDAAQKINLFGGISNG